MASLRAGCLPLAVETGRYRTPKVPLGERVCKLCNNGKVETEFHFVMECNKLQNLRNELFFQVLCTLIYLTSFYIFLVQKIIPVQLQNLFIKCSNYVVVFYITLNVTFFFTLFTHTFTTTVTHKS